MRLRRVQLGDLRVLPEPAGLLIERDQLAIDRVECLWELVRRPDGHTCRRPQCRSLGGRYAWFVDVAPLPGCARASGDEGRHHESPDPVGMTLPKVTGLGDPP